MGNVRVYHSGGELQSGPESWLTPRVPAGADACRARTIAEGAAYRERARENEGNVRTRGEKREFARERRASLGRKKYLREPRLFSFLGGRARVCS